MTRPASGAQQGAERGQIFKQKTQGSETGAQVAREVADAPSLKTLKARLNGALSNLAELKMPLLIAWGLAYVTFKGPLQPKQFYENKNSRRRMRQDTTESTALQPVWSQSLEVQVLQTPSPPIHSSLCIHSISSAQHDLFHGQSQHLFPLQYSQTPSNSCSWSSHHGRPRAAQSLRQDHWAPWSLSGCIPSLSCRVSSNFLKPPVSTN